MFDFTKKTIAVAALAVLGVAPVSVLATNGMNLEGYGPEATGMGGASMAWDNGSAAMMNNPATLGLMHEGESRLDLAIGTLGPDISSDAPAGAAAFGATDESSSANLFLMPALGYVKRSGKVSYGLGVYSQGGMGTEYDNGAFMTGGAPASGETVRSEVGVGRFLVPLAYTVNENFTVGGSVDFVWASMDLQMDIGGGQFFDMVPNSINPFATQKFGTASGSMVTGLGLAAQAGQLNPMGPVNYGRFDFSDDSDFTGAAGSTGFGGKIGATYKIGKIRLGGSYHSKTSLGDMKASDANVGFNANFDNNLLGGLWNGIPVGQPGNIGAPAGTYSAVDVPLTGEIKIKDFQWPEILAFGVSYDVSDKLMIAADYKRIMWSKVMQDFNMVFTADASQENQLAGGFAGTELEVELFQDWEDQNVLIFGAAYKVSEPLTLRAGLNLANNPVPDEYMNPLFPAIIKNHVTFGVGYAMSDASNINFSLAYAPPVSQTTDYGQTTPTGEGVEVTHSQTNSQLMYSYVF